MKTFSLIITFQAIVLLFEIQVDAMLSINKSIVVNSENKSENKANEKDNKIFESGMLFDEEETNQKFNSVKQILSRTLDCYGIKEITKRYVDDELIVDTPSDDRINVLQVSKLLMAFDLNTNYYIAKGQNLLIALHECYQTIAMIPLVIEVELVLKKIEDEGNKGDKDKLLEYFTLNEIKYPIWNFLVIEVGD
uniref:Uncharacterized protein n=1 Tax=Meloidogyne javanica TaxID=6303 RepID=A0A915N302_MELJA